TARAPEHLSHPGLMQACTDLIRAQVLTQLPLGLLSEADTAAMLSHLPETPTTMSAQVLFARTRGNPFFVEEFVRALSHERDGGAATAVAASRPLPLPLPTVVRSLIEERVTRLGADLQDLLEHAAILGQEFSVRSLRAMTGLADQTLSGLLERAFTA